jgi:hypothetical protein
MEIRMTCENGQYRCTLIDNGKTIGTTLGVSVTQARAWMRQYLKRIYTQGNALLDDTSLLTTDCG